ncbi:MAG: septum formation initiator family protein [Endomicrobiia bacterium]
MKIKKRNKKELKVYRIFFYTLILLLFIFYLKQQYEIINLQNKVKETYDKISILESENKKLAIEFQKLLDEKRLKTLARELNFVPISEKDITIIKMQ